MPARIRLQRHGKKRKPIYHVVIADKRAPRDGKYIEKIGTYNPNTAPAVIEIDVDKAVRWLNDGAQPSDTVRAMLSFKGILYKKHLLRGVDKGVVKEGDVETLLEKWMLDKEKRTADQHAKSKKRKEEKAKKKAEEVVAKKLKDAPAEVATPVAEETAEVASSDDATPPTDEAASAAESEAKTADAPAAESTDAPEASTEEKAE